MGRDWVVYGHCHVRYHILHHHEVNSADDFSDVIMKTVNNIGDFYNKVYPELSVSSRTL